MTKLITQALKVAKEVPLFPVIGKVFPYTNDELGLAPKQGSFKQATQDHDRIKFLFKKKGIDGFAVPIDEMSGLACIDVDLYKADSIDGLQEWYDENKAVLESTLTHKTQSGGLHFIFEHPEGIKLPNLLRPGVDIKATGNGYIVWAGKGYKPLNKKKPRPFPLDMVPEEKLRGFGGATWNTMSTDTAKEQIRTAEVFHDSQLCITMRMAMQLPPASLEDQEAEMMEIMNTSVARDPSHAEHERWRDRCDDVADLVSTAKTRLEIEVGEMGMDMAADGPAITPILDKLISEVTPAKKPKLDLAKNIDAAVAEMDKDNAYKIIPESIMTKRIEPMKWIIQGDIPLGYAGGFIGDSNVGKTRTLTLLTMAIATGHPEMVGLEGKCDPQTVIYIANEETTTDMERRFKGIAKKHGIKDGWADRILVRGKEQGIFKLATLPEGARVLEANDDEVVRLIKTAREHEAVIIIIDPYVTIFDQADGGENSSASATGVASILSSIQRHTGASTLIAHHTRKNNSPRKDWYTGDQHSARGSSAIGSSLDFAFTVAPFVPQDDAGRKRWDNNYHEMGLKRWVVLHSAKVREGADIRKQVFEITGQELDEGEGEPVGVAKLSNAEAAIASAMGTDVPHFRKKSRAMVLMDAFKDQGRVEGWANVIEPLIKSEFWTVKDIKAEYRRELKKEIDEFKDGYNFGEFVITINKVKGKWYVEIT